jgi:putative tricarboxylic transport membrane protein
VGRDSKTKSLSVSGGLFSGMGELFRHKRVASVSSGFGVLMGIIPGVGEFLAQFFSYTLAQRLSKKPELFGRGSPEGLVASESANNAVPAAAMIPLLALGIPGEALTAMMLSVFYVHNIIPGPALFQTRPEFLITLYLCLLAVNILILIFLLLTTNQILKVVYIPGRFLGVSILMLSFVGVYSLRNSIVDCAICAVFGILGFILKRLELPIVPIILGMILGRILEEKFRASLARVDTPLDFINRPVSATVFVIIVIALTVHFVVLFRKKDTG